MQNCVLNRERRGLKISVKSNLSGIGIKERISDAEKIGLPVFAPTDLSKDANGYSVYIRRKLSIKEYLITTSPNEDLIKKLTLELCSLWQTCLDKKINFSNFLFDYDAIFITGLLEHMEFTYLPGLHLSPEENSISDIFTILKLHGDGKYNAKEKAILDDILDILSNFKTGIDEFPQDALEDLFIAKKKKRKKIELKKRKEKKKEKKTESEKFENTPFENNTGKVVSEEKMVGELIKVRNPIKPKEKLFNIRVKKQYYFKDVPDFIKSEITVGRDKEWSDFQVANALVSRRHALIVMRNNKLSVRDLFSMNGTYVDGKRLDPGEESIVRAGQRISFGPANTYDVRIRLCIVLSHR